MPTTVEVPVSIVDQAVRVPLVLGESVVPEFSPLRYGAVADGVTDATEAIRAAIADCKLKSLNLPRGQAPVMDLGGQAFAISATIDFNLRGLCVCNGAFVLIGTEASWRPAGTPVDDTAWSSTTYALKATQSSVTFSRIVVDCSRLPVGGIELRGGRCLVDSCEVFHFRRGGIGLGFTSNVGECRASKCHISQWYNSDPEFVDEDAYDGIAFFCNKNDCIVTDSIFRWSGCNIWLGPDCATLSVSAGTHFYCGGSGLIDRQNPINVWAEAGANAKFNDCYLDNGVLHLFTPNIQFTSCRALQNPANSDLTTLIALYANGQGGPWQFDCADWNVVSTTLTQDSTVPGRVPIVSMLPLLQLNPGKPCKYDPVLVDGNPVVLQQWDAGFVNWMDAGNTKETMERRRITRLQNAEGFNACLYGSVGGLNGAGLGILNDDSPADAVADPPSVREDGGNIYFHRGGRRLRTINSTDNGYIYVSVADSGKTLVINNTERAIVVLPRNASNLWWCDVELGEGSTEEVEFRTSSSYPLSRVYTRGGFGRLEMQGPGAHAHVRCVDQNDSLSGAVFSVSGDVDQDKVRTLGDGYSYATQGDHGRELLVTNLNPAYVVLPYNARKGCKIAITRDRSLADGVGGVGSNASVQVRTNGSHPGSVLWTASGTYNLANGERVLAICMKQDDSTNDASQWVLSLVGVAGNFVESE